jgi:hypothetical protein
MTPVEACKQAFGSDAATARICGIARNRPWFWRRDAAGAIPAKYHHLLLAQAEALGVSLTARDLVWFPQAQEANQ